MCLCCLTKFVNRYESQIQTKIINQRLNKEALLVSVDEFVP